MVRIIQILRDMISGSLVFLDTGRIIAHVLALRQRTVYVFEKIKYQTAEWYSVISGVGLSLIKIFQLRVSGVICGRQTAGRVWPVTHLDGHSGRPDCREILTLSFQHTLTEMCVCVCTDY